MEFQKCDVNEKEKEKKERKNEQRKTNKVAKIIKKLQVTIYYPVHYTSLQTSLSRGPGINQH